jgi:hypothetical protein
MRAELSKKLLFEYYIDGNCERKFIFILDLTGSGWKNCIPACHSAYPPSYGAIPKRASSIEMCPF